MTKNLYKLNREELGRLFPIVISQPKTEWKKRFIEEKNILIALLGRQTALRIEHFGSTAVEGLPAKPTIDILVEIPKGKQVEEQIKTVMLSESYYYMYDQTDHMMFVKGYTEDGYKGQCYHIHMGPKDNRRLWGRLCFRDYLRANPSVAQEYATLKQKLAKTFKYDREAYTQAKTKFIQNATEKAVAAFER